MVWRNFDLIVARLDNFFYGDNVPVSVADGCVRRGGSDIVHYFGVVVECRLWECTDFRPGVRYGSSTHTIGV